LPVTLLECVIVLDINFDSFPMSASQVTLLAPDERSTGIPNEASAWSSELSSSGAVFQRLRSQEMKKVLFDFFDDVRCSLQNRDGVRSILKSYVEESAHMIASVLSSTCRSKIWGSV
jgi:hypothetical protein